MQITSRVVTINADADADVKQQTFMYLTECPFVKSDDQFSTHPHQHPHPHPHQHPHPNPNPHPHAVI